MADRKTKIVNFYESTLAALLASGSTTVTLTNAPTTNGTTKISASSGDSSTHYFLVIDPDNSANREVILVTQSTDETLTTITRDVEGRHATDPNHQGGTTVRMAVLAEVFVDVNDRIDTHAALATHLTLIDEDNMSTNSATRPPSQQSVKAYVDAQNAAQATGASLGLVIALS
tara:strand:- start:2985 stop:3503 length:519 start_codon:yes stop_codon:yes gene_type:complete